MDQEAVQGVSRCVTMRKNSAEHATGVQGPGHVSTCNAILPSRLALSAAQHTDAELFDLYDLVLLNTFPFKQRDTFSAHEEMFFFVIPHVVIIGYSFRVPGLLSVSYQWVLVEFFQQQTVSIITHARNSKCIGTHLCDYLHG